LGEISEEAELDVARERALFGFEGAVKALAANLIRIARGAGDPMELTQQADNFLDAIANYRQAFGHSPRWEETVKALSAIIRPERSNFHSEDRWEEAYAREQLISGALRVAAARLLDQRLQVLAGEREMGDGLRELKQIQIRREKTAAPPAPPPRKAKAKPSK
jgi:hypothetical protein